MENPRCTIKEFKKDISDLCENCPIRDRVAHELKKYDSFIKDKKAILSDNEFRKYLTDEIKDLGKKMEQAIKSNDSPNRVPEGITEVYIGNKEIIKLLTTFERNDKPPMFNFPPLPKFPPIPDGILKQPGIEKLLEIEKSLIEKNYCIDELGRWIGTSQHLADLLWAFKEKNYFISGNNKRFTTSEREFFKKRYKCKKQVQQKLYPTKIIRFDDNQFNHYFT